MEVLFAYHSVFMDGLLKNGEGKERKFCRFECFSSLGQEYRSIGTYQRCDWTDATCFDNFDSQLSSGSLMLVNSGCRSDGWVIFFSRFLKLLPIRHVGRGGRRPERRNGDKNDCALLLTICRQCCRGLLRFARSWFMCSGRTHPVVNVQKPRIG